MVLQTLELCSPMCNYFTGLTVYTPVTCWFVCFILPVSVFRREHSHEDSSFCHAVGLSRSLLSWGRAGKGWQLCLCIRPRVFVPARTELSPGWVSASSSRGSVPLASPSTAADCLLFGQSGTHTPNPDSHLRHTCVAARSSHVYVTQACTDQ